MSERKPPYTTANKPRQPFVRAHPRGEPGAGDAPWPGETAAPSFTPLPVESKSPEVYRASIQVQAMDTRFKGCTLCGNDRVLHIASQLDAVDICPPCLTQVTLLIERAQRKGTL